MKSHSGKRIMKDDTAPNYLWSCYNRVTKATVKGVISFWAARQRGDMSSKTLSRAALSPGPRHFISWSHQHCSRPFFTRTFTKRLCLTFSDHISVERDVSLQSSVTVFIRAFKEIGSWNVKQPIFVLTILLMDFECIRRWNSDSRLQYLASGLYISFWWNNWSVGLLAHTWVH